ncbi:MAG: phospholipase D-like domain-containing protein, partial [Bdellovibrionota bacterium]
LKILFLLPVAIASAASPGGKTASTLEVVQSVPLETALAAPGIRATQTVWLEMIKAAKTSIDLEQFYIDNRKGEALEPVLTAIRDAAARGVKVRLIVDSKFFKNYPNDPKSLAAVDNIEVKVIDFSAGIQHAKYFVVDGLNTYVGSANFDWLALSHIHEVGLHLTDKDISQNLEVVFAKDWEMAGAIDDAARNSAGAVGVVRSSGASLELIASPSAQNPEGMSESITELTKLMDSARSSLRIQVYQYSTKATGKGTWLTLDSAIRRAAKRGVKVQLMVDAVALKNATPELKALGTLDNIEVRAVKIPEWSGGHLDYARLIHSKYLTVDEGSAWVGTENWSEGYFTQSRNVGIILKSADITGQLNQIFGRVWDSAYAKGL